MNSAVKCVRHEQALKAFRWGPSWSEMIAAAKWLGGNGVVFSFNEDLRDCEDFDQVPIPDLTIWNRRWRPTVVSIGDWLVLREHGDVIVEHPEHFERDYTL